MVAVELEEKLAVGSFCRVGIAHHHGMSISRALSGNARPTLLPFYKVPAV